MSHTITGAQEAATKLIKAFLKKYPAAKGTKMDIGVDPKNGKFMVIVFLSERQFSKCFPETVDGYRIIIDGVTPLLNDLDPDDLDFLNE